MGEKQVRQWAVKMAVAGAVVVVSLAPLPAWATAEMDGSVTRVRVVGDYVIFHVDGTGTASCTKFWFVHNTDLGRGLLSVALTAKSTGDPVHVWAQDTCDTAWPFSSAHNAYSIEAK